MKRVIAVGLFVIVLTGLTGCGSSGRIDEDDYLSDIPVSDVLQTDHAFDGENIKLVGQVMQVLERSDGVCLQVDIQYQTMLSGLYPYPDDIHVEYHYDDSEIHVLPGHMVTLYGHMQGVTEFDGKTVRLFCADYVKLHSRLDDDEGLTVMSYDVSQLAQSAVYTVTNHYHCVLEFDFTLFYWDAAGNKVYSDRQTSTGVKHNDTWTFVFSAPDGVSYHTVTYEIGVRIGKYVDTSLEMLCCELVYGADGYNQVTVHNKGRKPFEDIKLVVLYYDRDTLLSVYILNGTYDTPMNRLAPNAVMELVVPAEVGATSYDLLVSATRIMDK